MNIFNKFCDPSCDKDNSFADKFNPRFMDVKYIFHPCLEDCRTEENCRDISEGRLEFTGPMRIRNLCDSGLRCDVIDDNTYNKDDHIKKSFPIYRVSEEEGCDEIVGAIWRERSGNKSSFSVECNGEYYVKYTWNPCFETEPKFEQVAICCDPCEQHNVIVNVPTP